MRFAPLSRFHPPIPPQLSIRSSLHLPHSPLLLPLQLHSSVPSSSQALELLFDVLLPISESESGNGFGLITIAAGPPNHKCPPVFSTPITEFLVIFKQALCCVFSFPEFLPLHSTFPPSSLPHSAVSCHYQAPIYVFSIFALIRQQLGPVLTSSCGSRRAPNPPQLYMDPHLQSAARLTHRPMTAHASPPACESQMSGQWTGVTSARRVQDLHKAAPLCLQEFGQQRITAQMRASQPLSGKHLDRFCGRSDLALVLCSVALFVQVQRLKHAKPPDLKPLTNF